MKFFLIYLLLVTILFATDDKTYPHDMIFKSIVSTISELNEINSEQNIAKKYNIPYPPSQVTFTLEKSKKKINELINQKIISTYPKFDFKRAMRDAKKKYPIYQITSYIRVSYHSSGQLKIAQGLFGGIRDDYVSIGSDNILLSDFELSIRNALTPGVNKKNRDTYVIQKQLAYNNILNKSRSNLQRSISNEIYKKYNYTQYKGRWWEPMTLLKFYIEKENIIKWDEIYTKKARALAPSYGFKFENKKFIYVGLKQKKETVYYDIFF